MVIKIKFTFCELFWMALLIIGGSGSLGWLWLIAVFSTSVL